MSDPALRVMSVEDYLRTEETSAVKREYVSGFVYPLHGATRAQAGASGDHVTISGNIFGTLFAVSRKSGCRIYQSDMKLRVQASNVFYYPDLMLVCQGERPHPYYETAPCLLVEVLSRRTAANDRHGKFNAYTAIPSLQTYLIVSQTERRILAYGRVGDTWELTEYDGMGEIPLACPGVALTLDEVYAGVLAS
jgi:Uma2 family endonuclease